MNTVLVEDNASIRSLFQSYLLDYCPDVNLIGVATHVAEGVDLISRLKPELVFLDVEMPDGTGFDLLKKLTKIDFEVVFITAHEKYALQAIKFSALDFLLKPIDPDELVETVTRAMGEISNSSSAQKVEALIQNVSNDENTPEKIVLKDKYGVQIIEVSSVIRLEAQGSYTKFFVEGQDPLLISRGLKEYEGLFSSDQFFRCHQSHVINMSYLSRYDKRDGDFLHLSDGSKVPLATRKRDLLLKKINAK